MEIIVETKSEGGHLVLYVHDTVNDKRILILRDNAAGRIMLTRGVKYRFEWRVWSLQSASYHIYAEVVPSHPAFPLFDWPEEFQEALYKEAHNDGGGFYFTL
ncbi:hypothetical protein ACFSKU_20130 [Pontibacter silvestris]|uniref:Uncharacterized protein n=1 Tax=Pontibacter silvestris TaxID=2305183 RepID=A0ABW4X2J6_9BACT|nr:hypothetical protein [Pontibacter silvestris]MCC9134810.1 hypothetical protein [Pontibacter silvestris]